MKILKGIAIVGCVVGLLVYSTICWAVDTPINKEAKANNTVQVYHSHGQAPYKGGKDVKKWVQGIKPAGSYGFERKEWAGRMYWSN